MVSQKQNNNTMILSIVEGKLEILELDSQILNDPEKLNIYIEELK